MKRLDQLTFTRFIAVLIVLFFHGVGGIYFQSVNIFPLSAILISATTAVTYLYALSGFVMALAHYRPNEKISLEDYWKARIVRLYPLYILAFLLTCFYYADSVARIKPLKTLANVFAVQSWIPGYSQSFNFPSWSITVEFFFYAVFPLFAFWAYRQSTKKLIWVSLAVWGVTQIIHNTLWGLYYPDYSKALIYFPLFHLSSFILGATAGIWFLREGREQKINPRANLLFFVGSVLLVCAYIAVNNQIAGIPHGDQLMTGLLAPVLTLVIITLALDKTRFSAFLNSPILIALGEISYAVYIFHIPIKWLYERALENFRAQNFFNYTYLPLIVLVGFVAHFYIDQPIRQRLKKALKRVSLPLLFLDLAILSASIYFSFRSRFIARREFDSYYTMLLLMFWSAFVLRTIFSAAFDALNPSILYDSAARLIRPVILSVTVGSITLAGIIYTGYFFNWFGNFPRSVFIMDWAITLALSLLVRFLFKLAGFYAPQRNGVTD